MCGRYYIAPDEEEEDWEEIIAILQRRGETGGKQEKFSHRYGARHCQQPQHGVPRPLPGAGGICFPR